MVKTIKDNNLDEVKASKLAVVDYSASWCGPCKMMAPIVEQVSEELKDKVDFFGADVDENHELAVSNRIFSVPTLVVYKNGEAVAQSVGAISKSDLEKLIAETCALLVKTSDSEA
jgi:thioredoxin 1